MEFCCKFNGSMKFQIILFGLLLSLSVLNGAEYFYRQKLKPGYTYFAYNPGYPNAYRGRNQCIWQTENSYNTQINCATRMGNYSNKENLFIKFANGDIYNYCDSNDDISINGMNPFIKFNSTYDSQGGLFFCQIQNKDNICKCGQKGVTKIVGGTETGVNEYPMMAGLVDFMGGIIFCGGTILSERYILTAAHCVNGRKINETGVVVGEHNVTTGEETNATKMFRLYNYVIHPEYNIEKDNAENDIAICKIIGIIKFNSKVGPACLPFKYRNDKFENKMGTALGWGTMQFAGKQSDTLQKVDLNVISLKKCRNTYSTATDNNMCTYTPGKDACQMDSGGPFLWEDSQTHVLTLIGITSMGIGCATENPAIWIRVGAYINWIISNTPDAQYCQA